MHAAWPRAGAASPRVGAEEWLKERSVVTGAPGVSGAFRQVTRGVGSRFPRGGRQVPRRSGRAGAPPGGP